MFNSLLLKCRVLNVIDARSVKYFQWEEDAEIKFLTGTTSTL